MTNPKGTENDGSGLDARLWGIVIAALLSGIGSGVYTFRTADEMETKVTDRYHASTAAKDFALRDQSITYLHEQLIYIREELEHLERNIPPPAVANTLTDHEARIRTLEKWAN